jgi:hypothetical protein
LGEVEQRHQLADADLAGVLSQHIDELHPDRIAERLGDPAHALGPLLFDVGVGDRLAADLALGALLLGGELEHPFTNINSTENCQ